MAHKSRVKALERKRSLEDDSVVVYCLFEEGESVERHCEGETTVITWKEWLAIKNDDAVDIVSLI